MSDSNKDREPSGKDPLFNFDMSSFFDMLNGQQPAGTGKRGQERPDSPPPENGGRGFGGGGRFTRNGGKKPRSKGQKAAMITLLIVIALILLVLVASSLWTEVLWFNQIGFARILWTRWLASLGLGVIAALIMGGGIGLNLWLAYHYRANYSDTPVTMRDYRRLVDRSAKKFIWIIAIVLGVLAGIGFAGEWETLLVALNGTSFGKTDPLFGIDISFFVFTLPFLSDFVGFLRWVLVLSLVAAVIMHYLVGNLSFRGKLKMSKAARVHIAILFALLALLQSANYFLRRYTLVYGSGDPTDGALYTAANAQLPAQTIMAVIGVFVAILFCVAAVRGTWRLPVAGIVVMALSAGLVGGAYPMLIQRFKVAPNARALESPYIQHNIDATYDAYGMTGLEFHTYNAKTDASAGQLREDTASTSQIRLLDPLIIPPTVRQMQQSRPYYTFPDQFAVDRYELDGVRRDTVIAVRELSLQDLSREQRTWVNDHTVYTHGFGVVAAYGNQVTADGLPTYWEQSIPSKGKMGPYEPRVYFSPASPDYSIVGAPKGAQPQELDYPDDNAKGGQVNSIYQGDGGPSIGNVFNKLIYAIKFRSWDVFFSDQVNSKSQILYDRSPELRVAKAAPFLTLERRPYPAVVDMDGDPKTPKRLVWVIDGYTTSNSYPYSQHLNLDEVTQDSRTQGAEMFANRKEVNYIRNSVKAVVDAYSGKVTLYQWDDKDPVLKTWMKIFPGKVAPMNEISGDLMAHLRYPADLFKTQRALLASYHVRNAPEFYTGGDRWKLSEDPTVPRSQGGDSTLQPPYYLTMKMPNQESAEFSLTSVFIPGGGSKRAAMAGFLAVDSETGSEKGKKRADFGKLRLIALPSSTTVPGPGQVQQNFNTNNEVARVLNLQDQQGSKVLRGNLLVLPVGGGLLYVEPVYVRSTGTTSYPQLRYVLVAFGGKIGFASTLEEALDQVFGGDSGSQASSKAQPAAEQQKPEEAKPQAGKEEAKPVAPAAENPALKAALKEAQDALNAADAARQKGDWAAYGEAQKKLDAAVKAAIAAQP